MSRLAVERAGDLDLLLHREVEIADLVAEVDVAKPSSARCAATSASALRRSMMPSAFDRRVGQQHVLEDGQVPDQRHFLECGLDAEAMGGARRIEPHSLARYCERPGRAASGPTAA